MSLHVDYLISGAGAMGMAFADVILHESGKTIALVDRRAAPDGHWNDAYPFVRLHRPSAFYGVNSRALGDETNRRRFTYITGNEEGFTYTYEGNKLIGVMAGKVRWREVSNFSFYSVKGTQVCPGDMRAFVLEQKDTFVTDEWKDKTVWDLINKYDL